MTRAPSDLWIILNDSTEGIYSNALAYSKEPTHGAIKGLATHYRQVLDTDLSELEIKYLSYLGKQMDKLIIDEMLSAKCEKLESALSKAREALLPTATPQNMVHTVYPKCYCPNCKQKEIINEIDELIK